MNQKLSEARANAVREYLISAEVDGTRLSAVGKGESQPIASNDTKDGKAYNRRIELHIN